MQIIRYNVQVSPAATATVVNPAWKYAAQLAFNTTASGAGVPGNVYDFPVLVRLTSSNFNFAEAAASGNDLRFTKADNSVLPFEIERWDPAGNAAEVWVRVDTIFGNSARQYIVMYWGNAAATNASSGAAVFDTAAGFVGVWHLNEAGTATANDATADNYAGTPVNMTAASTTAGVIGAARTFDGRSSYITMANTASGKLNFPENGTYAISAWVHADSMDGQYHLIASKGDLQYNLEIKKTNEWEFTEFQDTAEWDESISPAAGGAWTCVTGVRAGNRQYLYVNGVCVDDTIDINAISPTSTNRYRDTTNNFMLGKRDNFNSYFFCGAIEEVRVLRLDPGASWIKLCYMNQRPDDKLVVMK